MFFENMLQICVYNGDLERFLNMCSYHDIQIFDVKKTEDKYYLKIYAPDFFLIKEIVKKSHLKIKIIKKQGIFFFFKKQAQKKLFFLASLFCLLFLWIGSHFLWGIQMEGNESVTDDLILEFLQENGIHYGMPLSKIPIYKLKTNLRNTYDQIIWVSIYLNGTDLYVSIKENDSFVPEKKNVSVYQDLIAEETGIVESILVRRGTAMITVGEEVSKGDTLISGKIEIPAEDGTIKTTQYCNADGDIYIKYDYPVEERISLEYLTKEYTGNYIDKKEFFFQNKEIYKPFPKIPYLKYDSISEKLKIPLLDILSIPLEIKNTRYREYFITRKKYTSDEAQKLLIEKLDKIILSLEEKGVQIIEKNVKINTDSVYLSLTGNLTVRTLCKEFKTLEEIQ